MTNLYQSDVRLMSEAELKALSEELYEAYGRGEEWTDDAAETRYYQFRQEIWRRWRIANPGKDTYITAADFARITLSSIAESFSLARPLNAEFEREFKS